MFQRRHYEAVAAIFANARQRYDTGTVRGAFKVNALEAVELDFANLFQKDNARFDRARFLDACEASK